MDPAAWDFGTSDLTLEQEAAYLRIINAMHKHKSGVPDNDRVLAGLFRTSMRKARSLVKALLDAGKIDITDGVITNERAISDLVRRGFVSISRAEAGAKGGRKRAINAARALKNNKQDQAIASTREEKRREESSSSSSARANPAEIETENPAPDPPQNIAENAEAGSLLTLVMEACGVRQHPVPKYWMPPHALIHVNRWVTDLDLTVPEILAVARECRNQHPSDPPNGPRALDREMKRLAAAKAEPPMQPEKGPNNARRSPSHSRVDAERAAAAAGQALADGSITSIVAGPYAPGASRRR